MPSFILETEQRCRHAIIFDKEFFSGGCFNCASLNHVERKLQRCAGCQLVSYCNKKCQRMDWKTHKVLCKQFPVQNGKNIIVRKTEKVRNNPRKYLEEIAALQFAAFMATSALNSSDGSRKLLCGVDKIFLNARVCNVCHEARPEMLVDCSCCCKSYCSSAHRKQDAQHMFFECDLLYGCAKANFYLTHYPQLQIPDGLLKEVKLFDLLDYKTISKLPKYSNEEWLKTILDLVNERLAFPLTIHYALKRHKLGEQRKPLSEITSLTIHIVHETPMLDPRIWECYLHQLPNLKQLNLTFISGMMSVYNRYNAFLPVERCSDCQKKQRVITYNIQPVHYHEYFSSDDYTEPDIVTVFGIDKELMMTTGPMSFGLKAEGEKAVENLHTQIHIDKVNNFTSQRNMTYRKHTIVILTDFADERITECVKGFHEARPVKVLSPVQLNPVCGFSTLRGPNFICNQKMNVCCIQRKL